MKMKPILALAVSAMLINFAFADGQAIYNKACSVCHAVGVAGAPKLGDKAAWAPRLVNSIDTLVATVKTGKNNMPPMGTCMDCSDADLKAAVEYMAAQSR